MTQAFVGQDENEERHDDIRALHCTGPPMHLKTHIGENLNKCNQCIVMAWAFVGQDENEERHDDICR